jgi:DNA polymerase-3 subunit delta'
VQLIVGEGAGETIKIEQIRRLQREAVLAPYEGRYRVLILRHIDRATLEAANSLLKTLEEPPAHVVLGLTATCADVLPETVISRCQRFDLRPATYSVVEEALQSRGVPSTKAQLLARLSGGRIGWAFHACEDGAVLQQRQQDLEQLLELLSAERVARLDFAWKASHDRASVRRQIEQWTSWWRDLLLLWGQDEHNVVNIDRLGELRVLAERGTLPQIWAGLKALRTAAAQLEDNVNVRLALEGLSLNLPRWRPVTAGSVSKANNRTQTV